MAKSLKIVSVLFIFLGCTTVSKNDKPTSEHLQKLIDRKYIVGLAHGIISEGVENKQYFGLSDLESKHRIDESTLFEIVSITKVFTGTILAHLIVDKKVHADSQVSEFVSELKGTNAGTVTLKQLASHTSGLPLGLEEFDLEDSLDPYANQTEALLLNYLAGSEVGPKTYAYNNFGYGLLGIALVRADGSDSYLSLVLKYILKPLGMKSTYISLTSEQAKHFASPYDIAFNKVKPWHMPAVPAAGALRATLPDMMRFAEAALNPDPITSLGKAFQLSQQPIAKVDENLEVGMGWDIWRGRKIFKNGQSGGFSSLLLLEPSKKKASVGLSNISSDLDKFGIVWGANYDPDPFGFTQSQKNLDRLSGTFRSTDGELTITFKRLGDHLVAQVVRHVSPKITAWYPVKSTQIMTFRIEPLASIIFESPDKFELTQQGRTQVFQRK